MMRLVYDTESDGLRDEATRIHCIVAKDIDEGTLYTYGPDSIEDALACLGRADQLICHNQISHDLPLLRRITGWEPKPSQTITDTLVLSRAIWPDRAAPRGYKGKAPHSVEAYGLKFGRPKPEHEDWSTFSDDMLHRCIEDVHIQHRIWDHLQIESKRERFPAFAWKLEHEIARIVTEQEITGVPFDVQQAKKLLDFIHEKQSSQLVTVRKLLGYGIDRHSPEKERAKRKVSIPFSKRTGEPSKKMMKMWEDVNLDEVGGPFTYVDQILSSRDQIISQLMALGWQPKEDEWNFKKDPKTGKPMKDNRGKYIKTNPQLAIRGKPVQSLLDIENDAGKALATWYILSHRKGVIRGWLSNVRSDNRLSAGANSCGAPTARMKHRLVVNVPKANSDENGLIWDIDKQSEILGTQMRALFTTVPGLVMVGYDASGLESRMLAAAMNDPELTKIILGQGDVDFHTFVWRTIDEFVDTRNNTKNVEYALIYGATDSKLGSMVDRKPPGWSDKKVGENVRRAIMRGLPALDDLTQRVQSDAKQKGYVLAPDGRRLYCRSPHSALNVRLQGAGAITMKVSTAFLNKWVRKEGIYCERVIDMHDEGQSLVPPEQAEHFGNLAVKSIRTAGKYLGLSCPLDGEYKIGNNWAETH